MGVGLFEMFCKFGILRYFWGFWWGPNHWDFSCGWSMKNLWDLGSFLRMFWERLILFWGVGAYFLPNWVGDFGEFWNLGRVLWFLNQIDEEMKKSLHDLNYKIYSTEIIFQGVGVQIHVIPCLYFCLFIHALERFPQSCITLSELDNQKHCPDPPTLRSASSMWDSHLKAGLDSKLWVMRNHEIYVLRDPPHAVWSVSPPNT